MDNNNAELKRIKETIEGARKYWQMNNQYFSRYKRFLFLSSLESDDKNKLIGLGMPTFEFNILEAYVSRLRGEFSVQNPAPVVVPYTDDQKTQDSAKLVTAILKSIMFKSQSASVDDKLYKDVLCGQGVLKICADYISDATFDQELRIESIQDPTMVGFDPAAREDHKGDGAFCFELVKMKEKEFKERYPNATVSFDKLSFLNDPKNNSTQWAFSTVRGEKVVFIADYYEKKFKNVVLVQLDNGEVMEKGEYQIHAELNISSAAPTIIPGIKQEKNRRVLDKIVRYRLIENEILEIDDTPFPFLPLVNFDGDSIFVDGVTKIRSYIHNAIDAQRAKNIVGNSLLNEFQRMRMTSMTIPEAALPKSDVFLQPYIQQEKAYSAYVYNHKDEQGQLLPQPNIMPRTPIPPELMQSFMMFDQLIQAEFGTYDSAIGQNQNELSGAAIIAGTNNSNAAAKPFLIKYISAYNQVLRILVALIPQYYDSARTIIMQNTAGKMEYKQINEPGNDETKMMDYAPNDFNVYVEEGVSYENQKQEAIKTIVGLSTAVPGLGQLLSGEGLPVLLDNLDINGASALKEMAEEQIEKAKEQAEQNKNQPPPPDPMQIQMQEAQAQHALKQAQMQMDFQLKSRQMDLDERKMQLEEEKLRVEMLQTRLQGQAELARASSEQARTQADIDIKKTDQELAASKLTLDHYTHTKTHELKENQNAI